MSDSVPYDLHGWGEARLSDLLRADLVDLCVERGIAKSGTIAQLVDRLLQWKTSGQSQPKSSGKKTKKQEESEESEESESEELELPYDLRGWGEGRLSGLSRADLVDLCVERGIAKSGTIAQLVDRLLRWKENRSEDSDDSEEASPPARRRALSECSYESDTSTEDESPEAREPGESFRKKMHPDKVWAFRDGKDIYTGASKSHTKEYQVDHVIEIQVCKRAWEDLHYPNTRGQSAAADIINMVNNFNVTTKEINNYKHYPIQEFLKDQRRPLSEYVQVSKYWESTTNQSVWRKIEKAMKNSYADLKRETDRRQDEAEIFKLLRFVGQLEVMMRKMKVLH